MTPKELNWHRDNLAFRYSITDLTDEQVTAIVKYEKEKSQATKPGNYYSDWEELDLEQTVFSTFLTPRQIDQHNRYLERFRDTIANNLKDNEKRSENDLQYYNELLVVLGTEILPKIEGLTGSHSVRTTEWMYGGKINYIRHEYRDYLLNLRTELITSHFRNCRHYCPVGYQVTLKRFNLNCMLPDFRSFYPKADEPTKKVCDYLTERLLHVIAELNEPLTEILNEWRVFAEMISKKYYSDPTGWHYYGSEPDPGKERVHRVMNLVLFNKDQYGFI